MSTNTTINYLETGLRVFYPFGWDSWLLIIVSLILTGFVYWMLEFDAPEGEKQFEQSLSGGIASVRETFQGFVEYGIVGFAPGTTGEKILAFGFGFFLLILHSTYTANLAAILNNLQQQADLESLEGAENQPYSICIARTSGAGMREMYQKVNWAHDPRDCQCCQEVVVDGVLLKYDEATETYDSGYCQNKRTCEEGETCAAGILEREDILPLVESGHCKAAVMAKQDLIVEQAEGRYCGMKAVGNGLEMVYRGFPVRAEIAAAVRHYIVQSRGDGTLGNIFLDNDPTGDDRKYMDSKYEGAMPPMCELNDGEEETDSDDEANMSLDMVKMSGAFIWLGGVLVISIFVNLCQICIRRGKARTPDHGNKLEHVSLQGIKRMLMGKKGPRGRGRRVGRRPQRHVDGVAAGAAGGASGSRARRDVGEDGRAPPGDGGEDPGRHQPGPRLQARRVGQRHGRRRLEAERRRQRRRQRRRHAVRSEDVPGRARTRRRRRPPTPP